MSGSTCLPTIEDAKSQAKRLRAELVAEGGAVGHSRSLELVAHMHGYKDWNTLHAAIGNLRPANPVVPGQRVKGRYLGQCFEGEVIGVQNLSRSGKYRVTCVFDEPVDVVTSERWSAYRHRVSCVIDATGTTVEKTSDGRPHMCIDL